MLIQREIVGKGLFAGGDAAVVGEIVDEVGLGDHLDLFIAIECVKRVEVELGLEFFDLVL